MYRFLWHNHSNPCSQIIVIGGMAWCINLWITTDIWVTKSGHSVTFQEFGVQPHKRQLKFCTCFAHLTNVFPIIWEMNIQRSITEDHGGKIPVQSFLNVQRLRCFWKDLIVFFEFPKLVGKELQKDARNAGFYHGWTEKSVWSNWPNLIRIPLNTSGITPPQL